MIFANFFLKSSSEPVAKVVVADEIVVSVAHVVRRDAWVRVYENTRLRSSLVAPGWSNAVAYIRDNIFFWISESEWSCTGVWHRVGRATWSRILVWTTHALSMRNMRWWTEWHLLELFRKKFAKNFSEFLYFFLKLFWIFIFFSETFRKTLEKTCHDFVISYL